jgi:hypothetical protein
MKILNLNVFLAFILIALTGCESIENSINEYNSRPVYGQEYTPLLGMDQKYPRSTAIEYCKAVTNGSSVDAYNNSLRNSPKAQKPSQIQCRQSFGTVTCDEKQDPYQAYFDALQEEQNHREAKNAALLAGAMAMKTCMAQTGYVLKKVCVKNCEQLNFMD